MSNSFTNQVICGDCFTFLPTMEPSYIDLIISSPPYKESDGFSMNLMSIVAQESYRILKNDSLCFINFGHLSNWKDRPFKVAQLYISNGFKLVDTIIWKKNHFTPIQGNKHLNNLTEFIFMFGKGNYSLDRLSIGVPYQDESNAKRYNNGVNLRCGGNVWEINHETITNKSQRLHKDYFPIELPTRCIKLSGIKEGIVLDYFAGSFTTCLAAKRLGLNWVGIERDEKNCKVGAQRMLDF